MDYKSLYEQQLKENQEIKKEMDTMYHIIMNDGDKCEISKNQPLIKIVQFNIGLMLEKFKQMSEKIEELKEQLEEDDEGFATSDWFQEKMDKHIKFHMTDAGGEFTHTCPETNKIVYHLGSVGSLEGCREYVNGLNKEIEENEEIKKISNVKTDLINNLFSKIVQNADIDDGISISKDYGHKYIDEWNKMYEDVIKDTIKVMNENELDGGVYLEFNSCDNIEFCMIDSDDEDE